MDDVRTGDDASAPATEPVASRGDEDRQVGRGRLAGLDPLRSRIATVVWLLAFVCALVLAVGALLVALRSDDGNAVVGFVEDGAHALALGELEIFDGRNAAVEDRLTTWGIAAVGYLIVGKALDRVIRPRPASRRAAGRVSHRT